MAEAMRDAVPDPPEAILFDIGDTLVAATAIAREALEATAQWIRRRAPGFDVEGFLEAYREVDTQYVDPGTNHLWGLPLDIMVKACGSMGVGRSDALAAGTVYREEVRRRIGTDPAMVGFFRDLRRRGIAVGILSNGTTVEQLDTVMLLGLMDHVQAFVISEDFGRLKPDSRLVDAALNELGVPADRTWLVGDDPNTDGKSAAAADMVWVRVGAEGGDLSVGGIRDLVDLLIPPPQDAVPGLNGPG